VDRWLSSSREVITGHDPVELARGRIEFGFRQRVCRSGELPGTVVLAVDAVDLELIGQRLNLTQEVLSGEAPLPQRPGQGVRCRDDLHPGVGELTHQPGHEHGVAGIVEFEFVDADEFHLRQVVASPGEAQGPDEVRVFDEGAESRRLLVGMPGRSQQVSLAHTVAAVEVDALGTGASLREQLAEESLVGRALGEVPQLVPCLFLRGLRGVGAVAVEGHVLELRRRHEACDELFGGNLWGSVAQCDQSLLGIHSA
jgi:hypothetical protein